MKKRLLASVLAVCMLASLLPTAVLAEENVLRSEDEYADLTFDEAAEHLLGAGTASDPFQIWTAQDLYYINYIEYWNEKAGSPQVYHYQQRADLNLAGAEQFDKAYGYITANFGGVYDGGGFAISGMAKPLFYFTKGAYQGDAAGEAFANYTSGDNLFSAVVKNLVISEPDITQSVATNVIEQMGGVAAYAVNTTFYNIEVRGGTINGVSGAAAIAGRAASVVLDSCSSDSTIYATNHRAAGMVSNLRTVDYKKDATATSLVTGCTFSGSISGGQDGGRGSGGIVGAAYMDDSGTGSGPSFPLYLTDNTFSGTMTGTVTDGDGHFGGIVGLVNENHVVVTGNDVSGGTIENVTASGAAAVANVGGLIGCVGSRNLSLTLEDNNTTGCTLPDTNPDSRVYVGQVIGSMCQSTYEVEPVDGNLISTTEGLGCYGAIESATLSGTHGALTLPSTTGHLNIRIAKDANIVSLEVVTSDNFALYNDGGTVGSVTAAKGVNIYANSGTMGDVTAKDGNINVGNKDQTDDTAGQTGNEGTMGNLKASGNVIVYRNTGTMGSIESTGGSVTIGQGNSAEEGVRSYNRNTGTIGSVTAKTSVSIYSTGEGSVAVGTDESVTAGAAVTIGAAVGLNQNAIGPVKSENTSVSVYNGSGAIGAIEAVTGVNIYANGAGGTIASASSTNGGIIVGYNNTTETGAATSGRTGNAGTIGSLTSTLGNVIVYRNTGAIASVASETSSVTIGQGNSSTSAVAAYNVNAGSIGSVKAGTTVAIHGGKEENGSVATGDEQSITAGSTVTIGTTAAPNYNAIGKVNASSSVSGCTAVAVNDVTTPSNKLVNVAASENTDVITVTGDSVTLSADASGNIAVSGDTATYNSGAKLVLTGNATVTFDSTSTATVTLSAIEGAGNVTLLDANNKANITGDVHAAVNVVLGNGSAVFAGTIGGNVTAATGYVSVGNNSAGRYFTGKVEGNITAGTNVTIYNQGTIGTAGGSTTVTAKNGALSVTNGRKDDDNNTKAYMHSNLLLEKGTTVTVTNYSTNQITSSITNNGSGLLTLGGNYAANENVRFSGTIKTAGGLNINGNLGPNSADSAITVTVGDNAVVSAGKNSFYLKVLGPTTGITVTTTTSSNKNTIDLSGLSMSADKVTDATGTGTELKLPAEGETTNLGTQITSSSVSENVNDNAYYAGDRLIVGSGVTVSSGENTLSLTSSGGVNLFNFGTIGKVQYLGASALTIYNIGENAKIGDVTAVNGSVTVLANEGTIGNITAKVNVTVGKDKATGKITNQNIGSGNTQFDQGNDGVLGALTAQTGSVSVYRNAGNGTTTGKIGAINAATTVTIGQGNSATYAAYNQNTGSIGSVTAKTTVSIYSTGGGKVAVAENESVTAGTSVNIGAAAGLNQNNVGDITAAASVNIYNGSGSSKDDPVAIGGVTAGTSVAIYANGANGTIGAVTAQNGNISVGGNKQTEGTASSSNQTGNAGAITSLTAHGSSVRVNVYRNVEGGTIGTVASDGAVEIGQGNYTDYAAYNQNTGSIGSVTAKTNVNIYSTGSGSVATGDGESVTAGTSVAIGAAAGLNQNNVGDITAETTVTIYNEGGQIAYPDAGAGTVSGKTGVSIYANGENGKIGKVTSSNGGVTVGGDKETATTVLTSARTGNAGTIASLTAAGAAGRVNIFRNDTTGKIGAVEAAFDAVRIGQSDSADENVRSYNQNTGTIGSVTAKTNVNIYSTGGGSVATGEDEKVEAGTSINIGAAAGPNKDNVGSVTATTSVTIYNDEGGKIESVEAGTTVTIGAETAPNKGEIGPVNAGTSATLHSGGGTIGQVSAQEKVTANVYDGSGDLNLTAGSGDLTVNDKTTTTTSAPSVNVTSSGGNVNAEEMTNVKVNLTVTEGLAQGQNMFIRGTFASVVHNGAGDVIMESAGTSAATVVQNSTGEVKVFGSAGTVNNSDAGTGCVLSLVPTGVNTLDVYLLSTDGSALKAGKMTISTKADVEGDSPYTFALEQGIVAGGGLSEKLGTVTAKTDKAMTFTVSVGPGEYYEETSGGAQSSWKYELAEVKHTFTIPEAVDKVDTVLLTSADDFAAAQAQYGWENTEAPTDYPVLAVMPVVNELYTVTPSVGGQPVNDNGVAFVTVDAAAALERGMVSANVTVSADGVPAYNETASYTLTDADKARLDDKDYYYVTFRYMDGTTADLEVPVEQGQSLTLKAPESTRTGYTFLGWSAGSALYDADESYTPEGDVVFTARWGAESATYALNISVTGSGSVVRVAGEQTYPITSGTLFRDGETVVLRAVRGSGYSFSRWSVDGASDAAGDLTVTMDSEKSVTAVFTRTGSSTGSGGSAGGNYSVSVGSVENGSVSVSPVRAASGQTVTITVTPDEGYELGSLSVTDQNGSAVAVTDAGDGKFTFTMPSGKVTILAAFTETEPAGVPDPTAGFVDVDPNAWYYEAVRYVVENGLMNGMSETTFVPGGTTSRAMIATVLHRLAGSPDAGEHEHFDDVAEGMWYAEGIRWASSVGVVGGYGDGTFGPNDPITREQFAAMLYRYAVQHGMTAVTMEENLSGFADADSVSEYAVQAMNWAVGQGIINGYEDATLRPQGKALRSEAAAMLMRFCEAFGVSAE